MVSARRAGGPGGRGGFRFSWNGSRVVGQITANVQNAAEALARDLEAYLHATLHRDTGEMADRAFAVVSVSGTRIVVRAGSDAAHTVYHEFRYHPQLRQAMDLWAPKIAAYLRSAMRAT